MVPSHFLQSDVLPVSPNDKIDRRKLAERAASQVIEEIKEHVAPRNVVEAEIADIWAQCISHSSISVTDNFFDIGGDSIISMQVSARLGIAGYQVSVKDLFKHQTIEELAKFVTAQGLAG